MFHKDNDWENNACINFNNNSHYAYSLGYKEAANFLAENASEMNTQDLFIYPIAFLYRHHLELQLKLILKTANNLLKIKNDLPSKTHDLKNLWILTKEIILKIWPEGNSADLQPIDYAISEYQKIDSTSMTFRYSTTLRGEKHLQGINHISISELSTSINKAASLLDDVYNGLSDIIDLSLE